MLQTFLYVFGVLVIAGGVQGLMAGSKASIIAASIIGALILVGAFLLGSMPTTGLILALIGALGIAGKFLKSFAKASDKAKALWPAGVLSVMSVVAIVWLGLILARLI